MKNCYLIIIILILANNTYAQKKFSSVTLSPAAKYIFRDIKTKLTVEEKNFFANSYKIKIKNKKDTILLVDDPIEKDDKYGISLEIFPTDLNNDGNEEIFTRVSGEFMYGTSSFMNMYIKDASGKYAEQKSETYTSIYARYPGSAGYPDLIRAWEGPQDNEFYKESNNKFDIYRWNGRAYTIYQKKNADQFLTTDKAIADDISPAYQTSLTGNSSKNNEADAAGIKSIQVVKEVTPEPNQHVSALSQPAALTPVAAALFSHSNTDITVAEKNTIALLTGLTPNDINEKTRKGKLKLDLDTYSFDFNNNGSSEIFTCATTYTLGIPAHTYSFYAKNNQGKYMAAPGRIGLGVKILITGKTGFPDLIAGTPGLNRELWRWNGQVYMPVQTIAGNVTLPYKTMDIDVAAKAYAQNATSSFNLFDGEWHSNDYNYSFQITGNNGIATLSNSPNYHVGDVMLHINSFDGTYYHGQQIYVDGAWHDVILKKAGENMIWMKGGVEWYMKKLN